MKQVGLLALNDLRLAFRDRPAILWMFALPIAMMWFFGGIGGGGSERPQATITVVDRDGGWLARALVTELAGEGVALRELTPEEAAAAEDKVRTLVVPEGFTAGVLAGEQQALRLEKDPGSDERYGLAAQVNIVRAIVRTLPRVAEMKQSGALGAADPLATFEALGRRPDLVRLEVTAAGEGRPVPAGFAQSVPGILTMTVLMMTLIYGGVFLTIEKQQGMLRRQATLPLGRGRLLAGKLLGRVLIAGMQIVVLVLAGRYLFGVDWGGSPAGLAIVLASYALAVAGLATLLGALVANPAQASAVGWIGSMVLAALGGCWWPGELMPAWMRDVAYAFPTSWAMDAFHSLISFGRGVDAILVPSAVLLAFAAAFTTLGARFLRT